MALKASASLTKETQPSYVAYYRVSTRAQGNSGLGLQAQQTAVAGYVKGTVIAEYTEVESGKNNQRLQLTAAIDHAKRVGATLIIAKLDRLSRNASFIFALRDSGVQFQCVDMPDANTLTIGIFATLAQHERELISSRTRAALAAKIAQGAQLGSPQNLTLEAQRKGAAANRQQAINHPEARKAVGLAKRLRQDKKTYEQIAAELNECGFKTAQGHSFHGMQVKRLLDRISPESAKRD